MTDVQITTAVQSRRPSTLRASARWMVTFTGFPLGGFAALVVAGPIDAAGPAVIGGALTGAVLGAVQWWGAGRGLPARSWILATAVGLSIGLTIGASAVDFATDLGSLVVQGAVCGLAVGLAQGVALHRRLGRLALVWPMFLAASWAAGWAITTSIGVRVEEQFTVFGSAGAIVVTALTTVLPLALDHRQGRPS